MLYKLIQEKRMSSLNNMSEREREKKKVAQKKY